MSKVYPPEGKEKKVSPQEELKARFGKTAKVLKESGPSKKGTMAIVAVGVILILVLVTGHHKNEDKKRKDTKQNKVVEASKAIKARLDALKENPETLPQAPSRNHSSSSMKPRASKEMIARMNAPTVIYEGSALVTTISSAASISGVHEATFMGKGADQSFANTPYEVSTVNAEQVPHPESTIVSGEMLHATLNVAMNSDLPGMVTATVTSPAYSYTQENELIPRGSRLIGQYSSAVLQGQSRLFIMWNRVVLPDGVSVNINSPDTDQIGQSGEAADYINRHFWSRFGESVLMSILSAGVSNIDVDSSDEFNSAQAYRMAVAESLQESAAGTLKQTGMQKPTLVRYQGANINVFIAHDLSFYNLYKAQGKVL
jgi:type IV secretion system protein VirB10